MRALLPAVSLFAVLAASSARAQDIDVSAPVVRGQGWSAGSARTVGAGRTALVGRLGWPGLGFGVLHGVASNMDLGGTVAFNWGYEGVVTHVRPGLKLQGAFRTLLLDRSRINLGVHFKPGPFFYFYPSGYTDVGLTLPVGVVAGIPVSSALDLHFGFDLPFWVVFGTNGGVALPILIGGGVEYFIDRQLAVTFTTRMGPTIEDTAVYFPRSRGRAALFTLEAFIGVAYRL